MSNEDTGIDDIEALGIEEQQAAGEFDETVNSLEGAGEALAVKHLEGREKAGRNRKGQPGVLSTSWWAANRPQPWQHIKRNYKTILGTTAAGGALATGGAFLYDLGSLPDLVSIAKTTALSYPAYGILKTAGQKAGFYYGHLLNAVNRDRFREVKTEPRGIAIGQAFAAVLAVNGGVFGHDYLNAVGNVTYALPSTVAQGIPSALVDTFTNQSNTKWDMVWELKDQPNCLYQHALNPEHICLQGPGSEGITLSVDGALITPANADAESTFFGRQLDNLGINFEVPDFMPEAEDVNAWVYDQLGVAGNDEPSPSVD